VHKHLKAALEKCIHLRGILYPQFKHLLQTGNVVELEQDPVQLMRRGTQKQTVFLSEIILEDEIFKHYANAPNAHGRPFRSFINGDRCGGDSERFAAVCGRALWPGNAYSVSVRGKVEFARHKISARWRSKRRNRRT
jgi:hypothetical protein